MLINYICLSNFSKFCPLCKKIVLSRQCRPIFLSKKQSIVPKSAATIDAQIETESNNEIQSTSPDTMDNNESAKLVDSVEQNQAIEDNQADVDDTILNQSFDVSSSGELQSNLDAQVTVPVLNAAIEPTIFVELPENYKPAAKKNVSTEFPKVVLERIPLEGIKNIEGERGEEGDDDDDDDDDDDIHLDAVAYMTDSGSEDEQPVRKTARIQKRPNRLVYSNLRCCVCNKKFETIDSNTLNAIEKGTVCSLQCLFALN